MKGAILAREDYLRHSPIKFGDPDYQVCYEYWLSLKGDRWAPAWNEWQWMELPANLIPYFIVIDVSYDPLDFVYRFWGTAYNTMHGMDFTHKSIREIRNPTTAENVLKKYLDVTNSRQAIGSLDTLQTGQYDAEHTQTTLRMPMSNTGDRVDHVVTFADWRKDHNEIKQEHIRTYGY